MKTTGTGLRLSATDLANHLGCRHLTALDLATSRGEIEKPHWHDPALDVLRERGAQHEAAYVEFLRGRGLSVVNLAGKTGRDTVHAAMQSGADVIVQAVLETEGWIGRADILRKVDGVSNLGDWLYEVVDTKLANETRAGTILQLCLYTDLVADIQGSTPQNMHVVAPGRDFVPESFRVAEYWAYYRFIKARLLTAVAEQNPVVIYPEPVTTCDVCDWWSRCDKRRRDDDHASLVAGISKLQRRELDDWGIRSLADLAQLPIPLERKPRRGSRTAMERVREQARVQLAGRDCAKPVFELLPLEFGRGLTRLPAPSEGDVFFDIEGDPFVPSGGLEYLFGWVPTDAGQVGSYQSAWALNAAGERAAFDAFVDLVMKRWSECPEMHVYHFAPYEPAALKRLMGRYGSRQDEVDQMLRARLFVDLHAVVKQSLRASVERYSIKELEIFYGFERGIALRDASKNLRAVERALELGAADSISFDTRDAVAAYNRDDCVSTLKLRDWLESLRTNLIGAGTDVPRPVVHSDKGAASDDVTAKQQQVRALVERLLAGIPDDPEERSDTQHASWILAHLLEWHRREINVSWSEYHRLREMGAEELIDEKAGLADLELVNVVGGTDKCPIHRYRYPVQDVSATHGDDIYNAGEEQKMGTVDAIDTRARTTDIKKTEKSAGFHPVAVYFHSVVRTDILADALVRQAQWVVNHGIDSAGSFRCGRDLLLSRSPRLRAPSKDPKSLKNESETILEAARRLALDLDGGVLAIQGPPGAGKTYTGAKMICELVRAGKRVGIIAVGHKVIRNLLDKAVEVAAEMNLNMRCIQKVSSFSEGYSKKADNIITEATSNGDIDKAIQEGQKQVIAGTAWLWAREEMFESVDVLFVDEAAQMSLANTLAAGQAARNIVLLGDPQQLDQPLKASHPEGTEVSALQHLLGTARTIPPDRGLFLDTTWRLHPTICKLTSELFYDGRLGSQTNLQRQAVVGSNLCDGSGLWYASVQHEGNQNCSLEEVETIVNLFNRLTDGQAAWRDKDGHETAITADDVLIVSPYNAQVAAIGDRLPNARIGTVDKFQGQEAPVVIYSLATSSPEEAPRGMEFLFSLNRLNVATSRARCACILVANPRIFEPECRTPRQIQLANAMCRYLELAQKID